jgi:hypothetical protein
MLRRSFVYFLLAWAGFAVLVTGSTAAAVIFPPGSRVGLIPPPGTTPSKQFPGFEDAERNVRIAILDLPASAYHELENAAFDKIQPDLEDPKRESFPFESGIGFLISGVAHKNGVALHRWSLLAQAVGSSVQNLTALVNVEVPESALSVYPDAVIRKTLASVTFRPAPIEEQLGLLPYKFGELAGFHVLQVSPVGGVILGEEGADSHSPQPLMIVSIERGGPAEANDRARFARDLMAAAPVRELSLQSGEAMRITGAPGYEIRAQGKGPAGDPVSLVQWLRFGSSGYLRVIGVSPADKWDQSFSRFRAVRDGIRTR